MLSQMYENQYEKSVQNQTIQLLDSFQLESGKILQQVPVAYKTWGTYNPQTPNCIVVCHALSGSCDVEDWWGPLIGPNKTFDTSKFFIFCGNVLGSPYGTCSPVSIDPSTLKPYGPTFPLTTIRDDVRLHKAILERLGVTKVKFVIGGSMGGMQVLEWSFFGDYVENICPIATSGRHSAWCISWGEAQRQSDGCYEMTDPPVSGLSAARMAALLTYRSRNSFESRFGRKVMPKVDGHSNEQLHNEGNKFRLHLKGQPRDPTDEEFNVYSAQSYLRYQGDKFVNRFDANCYISITRKMDTHDISRGRGDYFDVLGMIKQPTLIIGIQTDGLFTVDEQHELGKGIPNSQVVIIDSGEEFVQMRALLSSFIRNQAPEFFKGDESLDENAPIEVKASVFGEAEGDLLAW